MLPYTDLDILRMTNDDMYKAVHKLNKEVYYLEKMLSAIIESAFFDIKENRIVINAVKLNMTIEGQKAWKMLIKEKE